MAANLTECLKTLAGRTILVGKTPTANSLMISVEVNGRHRSGIMTDFGRVPGTVSRCKPEKGMAHCKITVEGNGNVSVTNMKSENYTFVNNNEIINKRINRNSILELGPNKFRIDTKSIIERAATIVGQAMPVHLKKARADYEDGMTASRDLARNRNAICNSSLLFAILAGIATIALKKSGCDAPFYIATLVMTAIGCITAIIYHFSLYSMTHVAKRHEAIAKYTREYTCPNCGAFLGDIEYGSIGKCHSCNEELPNV